MPTSKTPVQVPDDVYDSVTWDGNLEVPTKNAVRDKVEALTLGTANITTGQVYAIRTAQVMV